LVRETKRRSTPLFWLTGLVIASFAEEVHELMASVFEHNQIPPRFAVGIVRDGVVEQFAAERATEHTRFRIASMTKSFTAAAVLQLRDRGAWKLDDLLSRWVPETLALRGPTSDSPPITLRHLVTMSAGMSTDDPSADRLLDLDAAQFRLLISSGAWFASVPGTAMEYSNLGYALLGEAIARATRQSPQRYITANVLQPLGLAETTWEQPVGDVAMPSHRVPDLQEVDPLADGTFAPMGGLWSTVSDLARWVGFLADAFPPRDGNDSDVLCRASRREMQQVHTGSPVTIVESPQGNHLSLVGYGMGLMVGEHLKLGKVITHSGGLPGYGSNMRWIPNAGVGVVALGNRTYTPMSLLTREIVQRMSGQVFASTERRWDNSAVLEREMRALVSVLFKQPDRLSGHPLAMNVSLDLPLERRIAEAKSVAELVGPVSQWSFSATTAASGTMTGQSPTHSVTVTASMGSMVPPLIQHYAVNHVALPSKATPVQ
jgi:CubicO group peptidase (beta-lactamase class C family)